MNTYKEKEVDAAVSNMASLIATGILVDEPNFKGSHWLDGEAERVCLAFSDDLKEIVGSRDTFKKFLLLRGIDADLFMGSLTRHMLVNAGGESWDWKVKLSQQLLNLIEQHKAILCLGRNE